MKTRISAPILAAALLTILAAFSLTVVASSENPGYARVLACRRLAVTARADACVPRLVFIVSGRHWRDMNNSSENRQDLQDYAGFFGRVNPEKSCKSCLNLHRFKALLRDLNNYSENEHGVRASACCPGICENGSHRLKPEPQTLLGQITFVKAPDRNDQNANQGQQSQQNQQGLSSDKKKSLSKYGPEDAFPEAREQDAARRQPDRSAARQSVVSKPSPTPAPTPTPASLTTATSPTPLPTNLVAASKTAPSANQQASPSNGTASVIGLVPITLSTAALLVFGALVYVVGILRKQLKEGNRS